MENTEGVHGQQSKRTGRGVKMEDSLWTFAQAMADEMTDGNRSAMIEQWVREKRDAVHGALEAA